MSSTPYDYALQLLFGAAQSSPDRSTQNAAVLISQSGGFLSQTLAVNDFPYGVSKSPERFERPKKYLYTEHAERNALYNAANAGIRTNGLAMAAIWAACADCARAIIQTGITMLIRYDLSSPSHWAESNQAADEMLNEAGVRIINISGVFSSVQPILRDGNLWVPDGVIPLH